MMKNLCEGNLREPAELIHREMKCPNLHNLLHFGYAMSFMFAAAVFLLGLCTV